MLGAAKAYAEANQAVIMTPFILAGAMSPATVGRRRDADARRGAGRHGVRAARSPRRAGRVRLVRLVDVDAVGRADVRHARARARAVRAGRVRAPPRRAVPLRRVAHGVEDRRRPGRLRVARTPCSPRSSAGVNFVLHAAGWLEGGLSMGYEKFVLDLDQCGAMHELAKGMDLSPNGQAIDAILANEPGTHFLGHGAHAGQLRDRVLPVEHGRQQLLRAVGDRRVARRRPASQRDLEADACRVRGAAARRSQGRRAPAPGSIGRRPASPTRTRDGHATTGRYRRPGGVPASAPGSTTNAIRVERSPPLELVVGRFTTQPPTAG